MHTRKAVVRRLSFAHRETNSSFVEEKLAIPSFYVLNQEVIIILIFTDHTDDSPFWFMSCSHECWTLPRRKALAGSTSRTRCVLVWWIEADQPLQQHVYFSPLLFGTQSSLRMQQVNRQSPVCALPFAHKRKRGHVLPPSLSQYVSFHRLNLPLSPLSYSVIPSTGWEMFGWHGNTFSKME